MESLSFIFRLKTLDRNNVENLHENLSLRKEKKKKERGIPLKISYRLVRSRARCGCNIRSRDKLYPFYNIMPEPRSWITDIIDILTTTRCFVLFSMHVPRFDNKFHAVYSRFDSFPS